MSFDVVNGDIQGIFYLKNSIIYSKESYVSFDIVNGDIQCNFV